MTFGGASKADETEDTLTLLLPSLKHEDTDPVEAEDESSEFPIAAEAVDRLKLRETN